MRKKLNQIQEEFTKATTAKTNLKPDGALTDATAPSELVNAVCHPIRSTEEFLKSSKIYMGAIAMETMTEDQEEGKKCIEIITREEARMDECRDLFEFDDEGELIGLL